MAERPLGRGNAWAFRGTRFRRYACPITGYCSFMAIAINLMGSVPAFSILNAATTRARPKSLFATMVRQPIWDIPGRWFLTRSMCLLLTTSIPKAVDNTSQARYWKSILLDARSQRSKFEACADSVSGFFAFFAPCLDRRRPLSPDCRLPSYGPQPP